MEDIMTANQYIFKVTPDCNMACTYCYQSSLANRKINYPYRIMSSSSFENCLKAACENSFRQGLKVIYIVLQGGEPLLVGLHQFKEYFRICNKLERKYQKKIYVNVQTNGLLIDNQWCYLFKRENCSIGFSIDGSPYINDYYRKKIDGLESSKIIIKGIRLALLHKLNVGTISVIHPGVNGEEVYNFIKLLGVKNLHFLLPAQNWEKEIFPSTPECTYIADYLIAVFNKWIKDPDNDIYIRIFENILMLLQGKDACGAPIFNTSSEWIVFSYNGSVEIGDCYGICQNDKVIMENIFDAIKICENSEIYKIQKDGTILPNCSACKSCFISYLCRGGFLPWRYSKKEGFNNKSYYCEDIKKLYLHIYSFLKNLR